jgi:iron complex outermembrane recepter protein
MNPEDKSRMKPTFPLTKLAFLGSTLVTGFLATGDRQATAAEALALEEVMVTARRQSELLSRLPVSATVFSADTIEKARITDIADYFLLTPNVAFIESGTRGENSISMRGISNIGSGPNSSFALYIDELNVIPMLSNPQLQDMQGIEVLRGPQGTFYGRNAAGGAINITTIKPGDTLEGDVFMETSSFDTYQGGATLNVPVNDKLFLRGNIYGYKTNGWIKNVNPVGGSNDQENFSGRLALRYMPTEALTIDTSIMIADEYSGLESGVPTGKLAVGSIGLWGLNAVAELPFFPGNADRINNDNPKTTDYQYEIFNNRVSYDFSSYTFSSITGYAQGSRVQKGDVDATSFDAINLSRDADIDFFSQEFRLASNRTDGIKWTVGAAYFTQDFDVDLSVVLGSFNPFGAPQGTVIRELDSLNDISSQAIFGEIDFPLGERTTFTYGGRYSDDRVAQQETIVNGTPMGPQVLTSPTIKRSFDDYSSKFALTYTISPELNGYLLAAQGYRTGGIQLDPALAKAEFDPETLWNYEAGIKGSLLNNRVRFSAAIYHIDWKDLQVRTTVNGLDPVTGAFTLATGIDNAGKASSNGVELELQAMVTDSVLAGFGLGYMKAEYDDYRNAVVEGATQLIDLSGKSLPDAPELTVNLFAQKSFAIAGWDGYARAEYSYVDDKVTSNLVYVPPQLFPVPFDFSFPFLVPSFEVINMRVGLSRNNYSFVAYVKNLTDENYYTGTFDDLFASGVHVRTHPREVGARVSVAF